MWPNNKTKTTIIDKKMFKYDQRLTTELWPIDHIGEQKLMDGKLTIGLRTKVKSGQLETFVNLPFHRFICSLLHLFVSLDNKSPENPYRAIFSDVMGMYFNSLSSKAKSFLNQETFILVKMLLS